MRGGGDDVAVFERIAENSRRNQPGKMSHIAHEIRAVIVSDLAHFGVIKVARIPKNDPLSKQNTPPTREKCVSRRVSSNQQLRTKQRCSLSHLVVVNQAGGRRHLIRHGLVKDGGGADLLVVRLITVRQMAAARQIETHDAIVRLDHAQKRSPVGSGAFERTSDQIAKQKQKQKQNHRNKAAR